jgi:outer membrane protein TolC
MAFPSNLQSLPGRVHRPPRFHPSRWRAATLGTLLAITLGATPVLAQAPLQAPPGQDIASVHAWLRAHNPELRAMQLEAEAARARILPAGALPDPSASIALRELDPDRPWRVPGSDGEIVYSVRQRFPLWGKRELARTSARQQASAAELDRDALMRDLLARAEAAYVRYWHADQAVAVLDRRIALLRQVEEIAGVRYALGMAAQQDAILAQVEQTRMHRERIGRLAAKREAIAALNALLGRPADAALAPPGGAPALPVRNDGLAPALRELEQGRHPAMQAQQARAQAARADAELERRNRYPDLTLGIGAMQRQDGLDGMDGMELMLEVEIPFQQRARREREHESRLLEDAALARVEATRDALAGEVAVAWTQWSSAHERREVTEKTLLPQADAAFRSALASYQVGEVDFGTLLATLDQWQGADLDRVDALRDELLGAAAVRALEGDTP